MTHEGTCRRLHTNRTNLEYRIRRFLDAQRLQVDRADDVPGVVPGDLVGLDGGGEGESLRSRLERGGFGAVEDLKHSLHGLALMDAIEAWEASERTRVALLRADEALVREEPRPAVERASLPDGRTFADLDEEERALLVERSRSRVRARARRGIDPSGPT